MLIRISKWDETFETKDTRKLVRMRWLHAPTGTDSAGYVALMAAGTDGVLALGVFQAICQWSATCRPGVRGTCARSDGRPLTVPQLASFLRISTGVLERAIPLLASPDVGWLSIENIGVSDESPGDPPVISRSSPGHLPLFPLGEDRRGLERSGLEGSVTESAGPTSVPPAKTATPPGYQEFVAAWDAGFLARYGSKPTWGAKQGAIVKRLLKRHGFDVVAERARRLLSDPPSWVEGAVDLGFLESQFDRLAQPVAAQGFTSRDGLSAADLRALAARAAEKDRA